MTQEATIGLVCHTLATYGHSLAAVNDEVAALAVVAPARARLSKGHVLRPGLEILYEPPRWLGRGRDPETCVQVDSSRSGW